ncbi:albumin-like, partial [Peromyscus leucopus]|uniref:albumin-like n=1 Tax=Peromyscus leucopus TaxID=10041 RepID=UPI0018850FB1
WISISFCLNSSRNHFGENRVIQQRKKTQSHYTLNIQILHCCRASITVAQVLQDAAYEEVQSTAAELLDLAEKCESLKPQESPPEFTSHLMATFLTHTCNSQGMVGNHVFTDCCKTKNTARLKCFLSYEKDDADGIDIPLVPRPELVCEMDEGNHMSLKARNSYNMELRHPNLFNSTVLTTSACYETAVPSCCQEDSKTECLQTKLEPIRKHIREISARHHHLCEIGIKFNDTIARAGELILLTKKQPRANFSEIAKLNTGIKNLHETCCEGNTVACELGRIISPTALRKDLHIAHSRAVELHVYKNSENDDNPNLSSLPLRGLTEDQSACQQFSGHQDNFLQECYSFS